MRFQLLIGTPATTSQMAKDVVTFLNWAAEPEHDVRKQYGIKAVIIFSLLFAISLYVKRFKWNAIKNRKICMLDCSMHWGMLTFFDSLQASHRQLPLDAPRNYTTSIDMSGAGILVVVESNQHFAKFNSSCIT